MLTRMCKHNDSLALTKALLLAAQRLSDRRLALSVIAPQCHLSQRERLFAAEVLSLDTQRERIIIKYIGKTRKVVFP